MNTKFRYRSYLLQTTAILLASGAGLLMVPVTGAAWAQGVIEQSDPSVCAAMNSEDLEAAIAAGDCLAYLGQLGLLQPAAGPAVAGFAADRGGPRANERNGPIGGDIDGGDTGGDNGGSDTGGGDTGGDNGGSDIGGGDTGGTGDGNGGNSDT